jgi:vacuolar-type H+-ATPase subunit I/STV1
VARAEESVRKAQARSSASRAALEAHYANPMARTANDHNQRELLANSRALKAAQTRLANLRAANPSHAPTPRDEAAKTAASDHQRVETEHAAAVAKRGGGAAKTKTKTKTKTSGERISKREEARRAVIDFHRSLGVKVPAEVLRQHAAERQVESLQRERARKSTTTERRRQIDEQLMHARTELYQAKRAAQVSRP